MGRSFKFQYGTRPTAFSNDPIIQREVLLDVYAVCMDLVWECCVILGITKPADTYNPSHTHIIGTYDWYEIGRLAGAASVLGCPVLNYIRQYTAVDSVWAVLMELYKDLSAAKARLELLPARPTTADVDRLNEKIREQQALLKIKTAPEDSKLTALTTAVSGLTSKIDLADGVFRSIASSLRSLDSRFPPRPNSRQRSREDSSGFDQIRTLASQLNEVSVCQSAGFLTTYFSFVNSTIDTRNFRDEFSPLVCLDSSLVPFLKRFDHCYRGMHPADAEPGFSIFLNQIYNHCNEIAFKEIELSKSSNRNCIAVCQSDVDLKLGVDVQPSSPSASQSDEAGQKLLTGVEEQSCGPVVCEHLPITGESRTIKGPSPVSKEEQHHPARDVRTDVLEALGVSGWQDIDDNLLSLDQELVISLIKLDSKLFLCNKDLFHPTLLDSWHAIIDSTFNEVDVDLVVSALASIYGKNADQLVSFSETAELIPKLDQLSISDAEKADIRAGLPILRERFEELLKQVEKCEDEESHAQSDVVSFKVPPTPVSASAAVQARQLVEENNSLFLRFKSAFVPDVATEWASVYSGANVVESVLISKVVEVLHEISAAGCLIEDLCIYSDELYKGFEGVDVKVEKINMKVQNKFPLLPQEVAHVCQVLTDSDRISRGQADVDVELPSNDVVPLGLTESKTDIQIQYEGAYTLREVSESVPDLNPNARVISAGTFQIPLSVNKGTVLKNLPISQLSLANGPIVQHLWHYGQISGGLRVTVKCSLSPLCGIALIICYVEEGRSFLDSPDSIPVLSYYKNKHRLWNPACESVITFDVNPYSCSNRFHPMFASQRGGFIVLATATAWQSPPVSIVQGTWTLSYEPSVATSQILRPLSLSSLQLGRHLAIVELGPGDTDTLFKFELSPAKAYTGTKGIGVSLWESLLSLYQYWKADVYLEIVRASSPMVCGTFAITVLPAWRTIKDDVQNLQTAPRVEFSLDPKSSKCVVCLPKHLFEPNSPSDRFRVIAPAAEDVAHTLAVWCLDSVTSPNNDPYVFFVNLVALENLELSGWSSGYPLISKRAEKARMFSEHRYHHMGVVDVKKDDQILDPDITDFLFSPENSKAQSVFGGGKTNEPLFHKVIHWDCASTDRDSSSITLALPHPSLRLTGPSAEEVIYIHSPVVNVLTCSSWLKGVVHFKVVWNAASGTTNGTFPGVIRVIGTGDGILSLPFCDFSSAQRAGTFQHGYNISGPVDGFYDNTKLYKGEKDCAFVNIQLVKPSTFGTVTVYLGISDDFQVAGAGSSVWVDAIQPIGSNAILLPASNAQSDPGKKVDLQVSSSKDVVNLIKKQFDEEKKHRELSIKAVVVPEPQPTSVSKVEEVSSPDTSVAQSLRGKTIRQRSFVSFAQSMSREEMEAMAAKLRAAGGDAVLPSVRHQGGAAAGADAGFGIGASLGPFGIGAATTLGVHGSSGGQTQCAPMHWCDDRDCEDLWKSGDSEEATRRRFANMKTKGDEAPSSARMSQTDLRNMQAILSRQRMDQERFASAQYSKASVPNIYIEDPTKTRRKPTREKVVRVGRQKLDTTRGAVHAALRVNNMPLVVYSNCASAVKAVSEHLIQNGLLGKDNTNFFLFSNFKEINGGRDWAVAVKTLDFHPGAFFAKELLEKSYPRDGIPKIIGEVRDGDDFVVVVAIPDGPFAVINKQVVEVKWDLVVDKLNEAAEQANFD